IKKGRPLSDRPYLHAMLMKSEVSEFTPLCQSFHLFVCVDGNFYTTVLLTSLVRFVRGDRLRFGIALDSNAVILYTFFRDKFRYSFRPPVGQAIVIVFGTRIIGMTFYKDVRVVVFLQRLSKLGQVLLSLRF